jgi:hypothetical protein
VTTLRLLDDFESTLLPAQFRMLHFLEVVELQWSAAVSDKWLTFDE